MAVSLICWALWPCGCQSDMLGFVAVWLYGCQSDLLGFVAVHCQCDMLGFVAVYSCQSDVLCEQTYAFQFGRYYVAVN